jgi:glyoxylase-like metal-dependent hydrolase (beta-lactamase superfamily II)
VRIVSAPGHTPGSAVLWIELAHGPVVLSGDLWISRRGRAERWVPRVNADRAATLSSMARIERLVRRTHPRVVVQHDPEDFAALPKIPRFLE